MTDEPDRSGLGTALRKANKGPAGAVIRTVTLEEAGDAFEGQTGERTPELPGANRLGGPGGKGSTAGIRTGSREAGGGLDVRAAENLRIRQQRAAAAAKGAQPATVVPPARTPVQPPSQAPLEDWEIPAPAADAALVPGPIVTGRAARDFLVEIPAGDRLSAAQDQALALLDSLPDGFELFIGGDGIGSAGIALVMGLGTLIGKGYAAYRGENHFRITMAGRVAARQHDSLE